MSKAEKLLLRFLRGTSDASFTFEELRRVLIRLGFEERASKGSHYTYAHPDIPSILTVPKHRPLKSVYVRKARALITEYGLVDDGSS